MEMAAREQSGILSTLPAPKRNGAKSMMPSTWAGRELCLSYVDGGGQETSGIYLDHCPVGPILNVRGSRTLISWDRLVLVELMGG